MVYYYHKWQKRADGTPLRAAAAAVVVDDDDGVR